MGKTQAEVIALKKHILSILPIFLCIFLLSGCSCRHQWAQAACSDVQVCRECGQLQGSAQTGHDFSDWQTEQDRNVRICTRCGLRETEPLPPEPETQSAQAEAAGPREDPAAIGLWTSVWIEYNHQCLQGYQSCKKMDTSFSIELFADGSYTASLSGTQLSGKWERSSTDPDSGTTSYSIGQEYVRLQMNSDGELILSDYINAVGYCFRKMDDRQKDTLEAEIDFSSRLPLGSWKSYLLVAQSDISGEVHAEACDACTVTFFPDGSMIYSMPEWNSDHIIETTWCVAQIHRDRTGTSYQYDFRDADTDWDKHFYITGHHQRTMYLEYPGDDKTIRVYLQKQEDIAP